MRINNCQLVQRVDDTIVILDESDNQEIAMNIESAERMFYGLAYLLKIEVPS